jgi:hypothetical protein
LEGKPNPTPVDQKALENVNESLRKLAEDQKIERDKLRNGKWRELTITARDAQAENQVGAFWRQGIFLAGTLFFSLGLLIVGFTGQGPERWLSVVLLGIVVFSLFVGRWSP